MALRLEGWGVISSRPPGAEAAAPLGEPRFEAAAASLLASFDDGLGFNDAQGAGLPDRASVERICDRFLSLCFPGYFGAERLTREGLAGFIRHSLAQQSVDLRQQVERAVCFAARCRGGSLPQDAAAQANSLVADFLEQIPAVRALLATDVQAAFENDPAATGPEEVVVSYPFLTAIAVQRLAHRLYRLGVPFVPRMMTEVAHSRTGIDIHPGASIGPSFFIDHGTGVVIGETTTIGSHCTLYHGVTLGAFNPLVKNAEGTLARGQANKRHPDLEDHVTVYPGATILGGTTVIGHHSVIGGNVWLTASVPPGSRVTVREIELDIRQRQRRD
jgi:serine O-acetyltransferase